MNKDNIPLAALKLLEREEAFRSYTARLNQTKDWYNKIRRVCAPVEFTLIKDLVSHHKTVFSLIREKIQRLMKEFSDERNRFGD